MSFYIYDIIFLVAFSLAVGIFLYKRRKNLKKEGLLYLYRTQVGIRFIDYVGEKYKKAISFFAFLAIISGYLLMASMVYLFYKLIYIYLFVPEIVKAIKIPPLMPLIPYLPTASTQALDRLFLSLPTGKFPAARSALVGFRFPDCNCVLFP